MTIDPLKMEVGLANETADGTPISLFDGQVGHDRATDRSGLDAFGSVIVQARAHLAGGGAGSLTLLVEHSDDGSSWSTAHSFAFSASGSDLVEVTSPKSFWRCRESASSGLWVPVSVQVIPAALNEPSSGGGSSALPLASVILELNAGHAFAADGTQWRVVWDALLDINGGALGAIPAELGLDFAFDGSGDGQITATADGCWIVEACVNWAADSSAIISSAIGNDYTGGWAHPIPANGRTVIGDNCETGNTAVMVRSIGQTISLGAVQHTASAYPYTGVTYATMKIVRVG